MTRSIPIKSTAKIALQPRRLVYILGRLLALLILMAGVVYLFSPPGWVPNVESTHESVTKSSLKNAIHAQQLYLAQHGSFKSCVSCTSTDLPGYHDHPDVKLSVESDGEGFILIAAHRFCRSGHWVYKSKSEALRNTRPFKDCR
ncbi:MAG: hypothetical protein GTO40_28570 [Deltaproteobacteria bacterium]|nr:hypothetical protein [Deltaproteobacteria bacterium]